jgi:hypothetical protein
MDELCYCGSKNFKIIEGLTQVDCFGKEYPIVVCLECGTQFIWVIDEMESNETAN